jgi:hypothetical protein
MKERYEWVAVKPAATEAQKAAILNSFDWDSANALHSLETANINDGNVLSGEDQLEKVLEQWWQPYHDFYVPDPTFFDGIMDKTAEEGKVILVLDEVAAGVLMPRYPTLPTINNMEHLQCGFYAVISLEQPTEPWSAWALLYEEDPDGTPVLPWAVHDATVYDGLVWVGAGIGQEPQFTIHHYLAVQASFYGDTGNTENVGGTDLEADVAINCVPIPFFTYHWFTDSVAFAISTAWDDVNLNWEEAVEQKLWEHTFEIAAADRRSLCYSLDYPDPHRPYRIRLVNLIQASEGLYKRMLSDIRTDWGALYTSPSIATVPIDKDNSRYISSFRRPSVRSESKPLQAGARSRTNYETRGNFDVSEKKPKPFNRAAASPKAQIESGIRFTQDVLNATSFDDFRKAVEGSFQRSIAGLILDYVTQEGMDLNTVLGRTKKIQGKTEDEIRKMLRAK